MKIYSNAADNFVKDLKANTVLVYGPDMGGVKTMEQRLIKRYLGQNPDPASVVEIDGDELKDNPGRLPDEVMSKSFFADKKVIRLRDAPDSAVELVQNAIAQLDDSVLLLLTSGELKKDSKIRKLYEDSKQLTALLCYKEDGQNLRKTVAGFFAKNQINTDRDCLDYLCANLGDDRLVTENELEKIVLFLGNQKTLELDDLMQILADNSEMALSEIASSTAARSPAKLEKQLAKAFAENASGVAIIRAVIWHFNRLILVKKLCENNMPLDSAIASLRPPVFFKQTDIFRASLAKWSTARLEKAIERLTQLEKEVKSSTLDQDIICRDLLIKLASPSLGVRYTSKLMSNAFLPFCCK